MKPAGTVEIRILDETHLIFEGKVKWIHFMGDEGEFDIAHNHAPTLSLLRKGPILMSRHQSTSAPEHQKLLVTGDLLSIPIERGIVKAEKNRVLAIVEQEK